MKHILIVLALGITGAAAAHTAWFHFHRPCAGSELDCQLTWIKSELRLTDAQFDRIKEIHRASNPRLLALAAQVTRLRDEYAAFERTRTTAAQVDFVEFARFVEQRRAIDRACLVSTRELVAATCGVMDASQRARYLDLLNPVLAGSGVSPPR
jgi:capsule polysaccharide export protein KpsE/RkpR